jgi:hypothetical protein
MSLKFDHSKMNLEDALNLSRKDIDDAETKKKDLMFFMYRNAKNQFGFIQKSIVVEHLAKNCSYNELLLLVANLAETEFVKHMKGFNKYLKKEAKNDEK